MSVKRQERKVFLVLVSVPYIGQHKWTAWLIHHYKAIVLDCLTAEEAIGKIKPLLPPENSEVKKALKVQDQRDEYYSITAVPLEGSNSIFLIPNDAIIQ